jgi:hypothetical protein
MEASTYAKQVVTTDAAEMKAALAARWTLVDTVIVASLRKAARAGGLPAAMRSSNPQEE